VISFHGVVGVLLQDVPAARNQVSTAVAGNHAAKSAAILISLGLPAGHDMRAEERPGNGRVIPNAAERTANLPYS
jgi:hypothetical protein